MCCDNEYEASCDAFRRLVISNSKRQKLLANRWIISITRAFRKAPKIIWRLLFCSAAHDFNCPSWSLLSLYFLIDKIVKLLVAERPDVIISSLHRLSTLAFKLHERLPRLQSTCWRSHEQLCTMFIIILPPHSWTDCSSNCRGSNSLRNKWRFRMPKHY